MARKSRSKSAPRRRRSSGGKRRSYKRPGLFSVSTVEKFVRGAGAANAIGQLAEPVVAAAIQPAMAGDWPGAIAAAKAGAREAVRARNLSEAFIPMIVGEALLMVRRKVSRIARGA